MTAGDKKPDGQRDARGMFVRGNEARRRYVANTSAKARRRKAVERALRTAITPAELKELMRSLYRNAVRGDSTAARELLARLAGKPPEAQPAHEVVLPANLKAPGAVADALAHLAQALARGDIDAPYADSVSKLLGAALEAATVEQLQKRLAELEGKP